jgi:hypothetical protein
MNGSSGEGRQSVWSVLDDLGAPTHGKTEDDEGDGKGDGGDQTSDSGDWSLMLYAPLIPTKTSKVEVARSLIVTAEPSAGLMPETSLWKIRWPWAKQKPEVPSTPTKDPTMGAPDNGTAGKGKEGNIPVERRVWVPSTTKVSLQVMWWGYRM